MSGSFHVEVFVLSISDGSQSIEGTLSISGFSKVNFEISFGFTERVGAESVVGFSSVESSSTISDFRSSESKFGSTVSLLDSPHSIMSELFISDLVVKFGNSVKNGG